MSHATDPYVPTPIDGHWIVWLWKPGSIDEGAFRSHSIFVSQVLRERFGKLALHFHNDPVPTSHNIAGRIEEDTHWHELDIVEFAQIGYGALPSEIRDPLTEHDIHQENWMDVILTSELYDFVFGESQSVLLVSSSPGTAAPGSIPAYGSLEEQIRATEPALGRPDTTAYSGPVYAYYIDHNDTGREGYKLINPASPINVAWDLHQGLPPQRTATPSAVSYHMRNRGNVSWIPPRTIPQHRRHVIVADRAGYHLQAAADDAKQPINPPAEQWHVRLFPVPRQMDSNHPVVGQAHRDPVMHNQLAKRVPFLSTGSWEFSDARKQVSDHWADNGYLVDEQVINNDSFGRHVDFDTSDGKLNIIRDYTALAYMPRP